MKQATLATEFEQIKAEYKAAAPSRHWRTRTGLGGRADSHLTAQQFWMLREYSRDMDRNDCVVGQMVDRAIDNIIGDGLRVEAQTSDKVLNTELPQMFREWGNDPRQCCARGLFTFGQQERLSLRHRFFDGDVFALPLESGAVQLVEGDRCLTPSNTSRNVVHGIFLDDYERPQEFWFTKQKRLDWRIQNVGDMQRYPAYDEAGEPQVFHVFDAKRVTQTRGVPVFKSVYDLLTMFEDVNLAKLVQAQVVSCIGLFIERDKDFKGATDATLGPRTTETDDDSTTRTLEKMRPGMIVKGRKGEKPVSIQANVPNAEYFDHVRLLLRIIGANIGIPLSLVLLDTSDTTFHGYRGELNEARKGFRSNRNVNIQRFNCNVYRWKVSQWLKSGKLGEAAKRLAKNGELFKHKWIGEGWPYVDPEKDAKADVVALSNMLESPRELHAKRGRDYEDVLDETIKDNTQAIKRAIVASQEITKETGVTVTWRDVLRPLEGEMVLTEQQPGLLSEKPAKTGGAA